MFVCKAVLMISWKAEKKQKACLLQTQWRYKSSGQDGIAVTLAETFRSNSYFRFFSCAWASALVTSYVYQAGHRLSTNQETSGRRTKIPYVCSDRAGQLHLQLNTSVEEYHQERQRQTPLSSEDTVIPLIGQVLREE